jgi:acetyl esterase/lipase
VPGQPVGDPDENLPLPAAGAALSPWTDLNCTGDSYQTNAKRDISTQGSWDVWGNYYVSANDPCNPWISPLSGDLHGLPPILIDVGDHEILLDDARRFAEGLILLVVAIWLFDRQVLREEDYLKEHYGQGYAEYYHRVRRYL